MKFERELSLKNLKRKPVRTMALILLAVFLSFSIFSGTIIVMSLQNGLDSYKSRLGADIVAVPYEAQTKGSLDAILLQGIPGYFYMDKLYYDKICAIEGVDKAAPQFFLASASSGCCSAAVQVIGFDPETDFSIQPWIKESYSGNIGDGDIIVGSAITVSKNHTLKLYDINCNIVAQLDETGTGLDTAVYTNMNTIKQMMTNAKNLGFNYFDDVNADTNVSSVMIKIKDGYSIDKVTDDINIHVRHIKATQAKNMISSISEGLENISFVIGVLTVMIWILAVSIMMIAFVMISNERKKEFAVLRIMGASRRMLSRIMMTESVFISMAGAVIGMGLACLIVFAFSSLIQNFLGLPYLIPKIGTILAVAVGSVIISVTAGWLTSLYSASRIEKNETGLILREDA